jgi:hypothetical protein
MSETTNMPGPFAQVKAILPVKDVGDECLYLWAAHNGRVTIEYGDMYAVPSVFPDQLERLKELFGASDVIVVQGYSVGGCESCDYGSLYCTEIHLHGCTKHLEASGHVGRKHE